MTISNTQLIISVCFALLMGGTLAYLIWKKNRMAANQGAKVIRFRLAGEGWLNPSTFRIMMDVVNDDNIGRVNAFFRRLRIAVRGQIIEDIDNFNRVSELFHVLQTTASRENDNIEGFGYQDDIANLNTTAWLPGITDYQSVMFKPLSGLLFVSSNKILTFAIHAG